MKKRVWALLLVIACLVTLLSGVASAAETDAKSTVTIRLDLSNYPFEIGQSTKITNEINGIRTLEPGKVNVLQFSTASPINEHDGEIKFNLASLTEAVSWNIADINYKTNNDDIWLGTTGDEMGIWVQAYKGQLVVTVYGYDSGYGTTPGFADITIVPVLLGADYTAKATASSEDEEKGTAVAVPTKTNNTYSLAASAKDGYSFDSWTEQNGEWTSKENPATTAALTKDTAFVAHFHAWTQPSVVCVDENSTEIAGLNGSAARVKDDTWKLTAGTAVGWKFTYWSKGDDASQYSTAQTLTAESVTEATTYYAHYEPVYITGITSVKAYTNGPGSTAAGTGTGLAAGASVTVAVKYTANGDGVADSCIAVYAGGLDEVKAAVEAGTASPLAEQTFDGRLDNTTANLVVPKWPADLEKLTAVAGTEGRTPYYQELTVSTRTVNALGLTYLSTPVNSAVFGTVSGPRLYGTQAYIDAANGGIALYAVGFGGVYRLETTGTTDLVQMPGMEDLKTSGAGFNDIGSALAIGRAGDDSHDLVALVYSVADMQINNRDTYSHYELRYYDADKGIWEKRENTVLDPAQCQYSQSNSTPNSAVVFAADNVWMQYMHWDGAQWLENSQTEQFVSFRKVSDTVAYAMQRNGTLYRYDGDGWTLVTLPAGVTARANSRVFNVTPDEKLLLQTQDNSFVVLSRDSSGAYTTDRTVPAIPTDVLGDVWTTDSVTTYAAVRPDSITIVDGAISSDGSIYMVVNGSSSTRAYIVRYDENAWTLLDTADAFDIGGAAGSEARPTAITTAATPAAGITVYFGSDGSFYLQTESHTVTFNSNGGTDVTPVTGPAWSTITVPQPTKTGYTFAGWYTDEDCTTLWESPVIPNADLIVYAKWTSAEDPYAKDRQMALEQLDAALARLDQNDYSAANWQKVLTEYENGKYRITIAEPKPAGTSQAEIDKAVQDTIYAALNNAIDRMSAVPTMTVKDITVAVSMDADTLGLGYLIKPTLVTVPKYTQASKVITDLIVAQNKDSNELMHTGKQDKGNNGEQLTAPYYDYLTQGTVEDSFYLAHVYYPQQTEAHVADYITAKTGQIVYDKYKNGHYLGEFDYYNMSGWMYSIADKTTGGQSFPGVGAAGWRMRDGEVMRWQFTVYGYGADLNADNSMYGTASITGEIGDKTQLTYKIAEMREQYKDASEDKTYTSGDNTLESSRIYTNVLEGILGNPQAKQDALDTAMEDLELVATELKYKDIFAGIADAVDAGSLSAALNAYNNQLTEQAKKAFDKAYPEQAEKLHAAMDASDREAAQAVIDKINALGDPDKVTLKQEEAVKEAREAYDALTKAQQELVGKGNLEKLEKAEARIEDLKKPTPPTPVTPVTPSKPSTPKDDKPAGSSFSDVASGSWYEEAVKYVSEKSLMNGTATGTFSPNANTTRGMIVTILARVEGVNTNGTPWYAAGQKWAMDNGISDGTNMPGVITREQLATILYRNAKQKGYDVSKSAALTAFSDADKVSGYAAEAMQWAVAEGLLQGSNGKLNPQGSATRAQVATILMRFMEKIAK